MHKYFFMNSIELSPKTSPPKWTITMILLGPQILYCLESPVHNKYTGKGCALILGWFGALRIKNINILKEAVSCSMIVKNNFLSSSSSPFSLSPFFLFLSHRHPPPDYLLDGGLPLVLCECPGYCNLG